MGTRAPQPATAKNSVRTSKRTGAFALNDGRSAFAYRFRTLIAQRCADLGGAESLSAQQHSLVRRSVMLELSLEKLENDAAAGTDVDLDVYTRATGTLARLLKTLGLKKATAKPAPSLANWKPEQVNPTHDWRDGRGE